ncbi:MAG: four-helix bundle copper-binding protein, partial [Proteobacteria bacterium]
SHCLEVGGRHVAPEHFRLMIACAEMCRASASLMLIGTPLHKQTCRVCAEVCEACAASCEGLDGMEDCVAACRQCAESCRRMAA